MLRPGLSFARRRSPRRGGKSQRSEETREFRLTGLSGGRTLTNGEITSGPRNDGAERTNLSAGSAYLPHDPSESSGESAWAEPPREHSYRRAVTDFELYASEIGEHLDWKNDVEIEGTCLEYLDLLFTQGFGPEVGNRLMNGIRTSFSRYSRHGDLDMPRTVIALKGWTRLTPPMSRWSLPWTKVAAALVILWPRRLRSATWPASWRVSNAARKESRGAKQTRNKGVRPDIFLWQFERKSGIPSKTRTFDDSVILDRPDLLWMDRLWQALIVGRAGHARLKTRSHAKRRPFSKDSVAASWEWWHTVCDTEGPRGTS